MMFLPGEKSPPQPTFPSRTGDYLYTRLREGGGNRAKVCPRLGGGTSAEEGMEIPQMPRIMTASANGTLGGWYTASLSAATSGAQMGIPNRDPAHQAVPPVRADGMTEEEIRQLFTQEMLLSPGKLDLAIQTQKNEQKVLSSSTRDSFACTYPSRSAPAGAITVPLSPIPSTGPKIDARICLPAWWRSCGTPPSWVDQIGIKLKTVYFGGVPPPP